MFNITITKDK